MNHVDNNSVHLTYWSLFDLLTSIFHKYVLINSQFANSQFANNLSLPIISVCQFAVCQISVCQFPVCQLNNTHLVNSNFLQTPNPQISNSLFKNSYFSNSLFARGPTLRMVLKTLVILMVVASKPDILYRRSFKKEFGYEVHVTCNVVETWWWTIRRRPCNQKVAGTNPVLGNLATLTIVALVAATATW